MRNIVFKLLICVILLFILSSNRAQNEITVVTLDNPAPGYLLMDSYQPGYIKMIDNSGIVVYKKKIEYNESVRSFVEQSNGLFTYFVHNKFYVINSELVLLDSFTCKNGYETDFHDFKLLNNNHALLLGIKLDTVDMSVIVPGGNPEAILRSSVIQEQDENKNVVWEWKTLDHYLITDATNDVDLTNQQIEWVHTNCVQLDFYGNLLISNRNIDEITKINKQTGNIIWRLGGMQCKNNQFTFLNDTINGFWGFSHQHSVHRLSNGNLLLYDNGNLRPSPFSRAVEYEIDETNKTIRKIWEYKAFPDVFSMFQGSVQRLPNGNTLISWGTNTQQMVVNEVSPEGSRAIDIRNFEPNMGISYMAMRSPINMASKLILIENKGNYNFFDDNNKTAVSLNIQSMIGSGFVSVERHYYTPHNISHEESSPLTTYGHRWVLNNKGISQFTGKIIFKLSEIDSLDSPEKYNIYWRKQEGSGNFTILETSYNKSLGTIESYISSFGEFILGEPPKYIVPEHLSPENNSKKNNVSLALIWEQSAGANSYRLQISQNNIFSAIIIDTLIIGDTSFTYNTFPNNTTYYWRLKSLYDTNESNWSNPWNFTTLLKSPLLIKPINGEQDFPLSGFLEWYSVTGATYYKINISERSDFDSIIVDETGITDTIFSTVLPDYKRNYYFRVKAMNFDNESLWSDTISFTTIDKKMPSVPILLYPPNDTIDMSTSGYLRWNPVIDVTSYNVEISIYPDFLSYSLNGMNIDSTYFFYSGIDYNTIYYWHVASVNELGTSEWSDTWMFVTQKELSVNNDNNNINKLYVLSTGDIFTIIIRNCEPGSYLLKLYDVRGYSVKESFGICYDNDEVAIKINKSDLNSGLYLYRLLISHQIITGKIFIQN